MADTAPVPITDEGARRILGTPEFKVADGGYDPSDVARYLDRFGRKAMDLMERLREAEAAAETARRDAADLRAGAATPESSKDLFQRTLALAEQTASATVADARQRATQLSDETERAAARRVEEARMQVERMLDDARQQAQAIHADDRAQMAALRERILDESAQLETLRLATAAETMALEESRNELRRRIRAMATDLIGVAEHPEALGTPIAHGIPDVAPVGTAELLVPAASAAPTAEPAGPAGALPIQADAGDDRATEPPTVVNALERAAREAVGHDEPALADTPPPAPTAATDEPPPADGEGREDDDAFARFMSTEIEDEPSRDWIMA